MRVITKASRVVLNQVARTCSPRTSSSFVAARLEAWSRVIREPLWALVLAGILGCASGEPPPRTLVDPGNPKAPEGATMTTATRAPVAAEPSASVRPAAASSVYSCPMHPEVVRDAPGACPKCGMTLVKAAR